MSVSIFVPDIPELKPLLEAAQAAEACTIHPPQNGYWRIEAERELRFQRKRLGLGPALWNSALSGGFRGRIVEYGRDIMLIESEDR